MTALNYSDWGLDGDHLHHALGLCPKVPRWGRTAVHIKLRRAIRLAIRTCRLLFCTEAELPNLFTCKDADPETASSALALDECKLSECLSERAGKAPWYSQSVEKNL